MADKLRFAPIIRVSTETQEQQGESLNIQKTQIINAVNSLNGVIPRHCWKYSGQEHATPEYERKKFDQLLEDSGKDLFDAVIVFDASRWSRDNRNSKKGLDILKKNGKRFFILSAEFDLFNPQATLFLGMSTEMNEYFALEQSRKSMLSRIAKAKRGFPSLGAQPYGRKYNRDKGQWEITRVKQKDIEWAAEKYLSGSTMLSLSEVLGMHVSTLWDILKNRCGDIWPCRFQNKRVGIDETVEMKVPRLLPQETIDAIHQRLEANKTYTHGQPKHRYLLGRVIFCEHCGRSLGGMTDTHCGYQYYRHPHTRKKCPGPYSVRADVLEDAVMTQLLNLAINPAVAEKAHTDTLPEPEKRGELEKELKALSSRLGVAQAKKRKIIDMIADDIISIADGKPNIEKLKAQEEALQKEIRDADILLQTIPDPSMIKRKTRLAQNTLRAITRRVKATEEHYRKMSWEDKRKLVQTIFGGHDINGNRAGVCIRKNGDGVVEYELRGDLLNDKVCGIIPMLSDEYEELLRIFRPERDLGPEDFVTNENSEEKRADSHRKQDWDGKGDRHCEVP